MIDMQTNSKIDITNNEIEINCYLKSDLKKPQVSGFLKNLQNEYLNLHTGHIKFDVKTMDGKIVTNSLIKNEEQAGGQYVKHEYKVLCFDEEKCEMNMESPHSKVFGRFLFKNYQTEVATTVEFKFSEDDVFHSKLILKFKNKIDLISALIVGTKKIWREHFEQEISRGGEIMIAQNI